MDPLAHTLFGAALAEAGLRRASCYATAALLIGANLPDLDVIAHLWGADAALFARRGWTHGVLAMAVLPLLLTGALLLWARWRRADPSRTSPLRPGALLMVACLAVWSHPLLDWMNTYGVRLLMPFDERWLYGDTLFIVDPWLWLLLVAGVVMARSVGWPARIGWLLLAGYTTHLVLARSPAPGVALGWCLGLAAIVLLRWQLPSHRAARLAQLGLAATVTYTAVLFGLARHAEALAGQRFPDAQTVQASPVAGVPYAHRILIVHRERYRILYPDGSRLELDRAPMDDLVRRALADPSIRGFANWQRFLWWELDVLEDGTRVHFYDLRYARPGSRSGIGYAAVTLRER